MDKNMTSDNGYSIREDWYVNLIEDLKNAIVEKIFNARREIIEMKHMVGELIINSENDFERFGYGEHKVETIAKDLGVSTRDLYRCIEFVKLFPSMESFDTDKTIASYGKNISWNKVINEVLPQGSSKTKPDKPEKNACQTIIAIITNFFHYKKITVSEKEIEGLAKKIEGVVKNEKQDK